MLSHFSHVCLLAILWTIAHKAPLSIGCSRQDYWSGFPCPPPGDLPYPEVKHKSPVLTALQADSLPLSHWRSPFLDIYLDNKYIIITSGIVLHIFGTHNIFIGASLVAQWSNTHLTMQNMYIRYLDWEDPWSRKWKPTSVFLPWKSHGQKKPSGPQSIGSQESNTTSWLNNLFIVWLN